jgi:hypothetical protein
VPEIMLCPAAFAIVVTLVLYLLTHNRPKASGGTTFYFADDDDDDGDPSFTPDDVGRFLNDPGGMWARNPGRAANIASMMDDITHDED